MRDLLDKENTKFRESFAARHLQFKTLIHSCQSSAYQKANASAPKQVTISDLQRVESASQKCFQPLIMLRKHVGVIMDNQLADFEKCREECEKNAIDRNVGSRGVMDNIKRYCFTKYRDGLEENR